MKIEIPWGISIFTGICWPTPSGAMPSSVQRSSPMTPPLKMLAPGNFEANPDPEGGGYAIRRGRGRFVVEPLEIKREAAKLRGVCPRDDNRA